MDTSYQEKETIFSRVEADLKAFLRIRYIDKTRPWGGFCVIDEDDANIFIQAYFPHLDRKALDITGKLSPKILLVAPGKKLSWQYHHRRAEIWKMLEGEAVLQRSDNDEPGEEKIFAAGDIVELRQGERHRLAGLDTWGIVAEIWRHTDAAHPSDEEDIIRIEDDFGRA